MVAPLLRLAKNITIERELWDPSPGSPADAPARYGLTINGECQWCKIQPEQLDAAGDAPLRFSYCSGYGEPPFFWLVDLKVYVSEDPDLTPDDVRALTNEIVNRRRLRLEKAHALQAMTDQLDARTRRERIPQDVKIAVWQRDAGRCVECGANSELEFDHIIPLAMGGANTLRNLQLLCATCNRRKGATLG